MPVLSVILVEPQTPANIGMVSRAMANFGLDELRLVNPCDHLDASARRLAVGAAPLLEKAESYPTLAAALADQHVSVAATRRSGRYRGTLQELADIAPHLRQLPEETRVALVFGREDSGLTLEEVETCQHAVTIRTSETLGSLNLAQAVILFLYELTRSPGAETLSTASSPTHADSAQLCAQVEKLLHRTGFLNPQRPDAIMQPLRRMLSRANPDLDEFNLLRGMFAQLDASASDWRGKRRGKSDK